MMFVTSFCPLNVFRSRSSHLVAVRLRHKINKQISEKPPTKAAADVVKYLESTPECAGIMEKFPKALLRKYKTPEIMYLINKNTAKVIAKAIENQLGDSPVVEVNPGLGFLTKELLKKHNNHHYLFENSSHFTPYLEDIRKQYPNRVTYKIDDFFGMWKLAFLDKMDDGNRIKELLGNLATENNERVVKVIGSIPGLSFLKHLIYTIVFHHGKNQLGRPDLFITLPSERVQFLFNKDIHMSKHKYIPALFQILFDHKVITTVPKVHFLPWIQSDDATKEFLLDDYRFYLVNITQKEKLPCPQDNLPLLWYFFKPHVFSRSTRVIPMLEQWIPGCGVWLITGQDPPDTRRDLAPGPEDAPLPHMTIFTEFGDLTLAQKVTVFKKSESNYKRASKKNDPFLDSDDEGIRFISWPEFEQCQFRVTMENNLPKSVTHAEDDEKDSIGTPIEDLEHSDSEHES